MRASDIVTSRRRALCPYLALITHTRTDGGLIISQNSAEGANDGSASSERVVKMSFSPPTLNASYASVTDPGEHRYGR